MDLIKLNSRRRTPFRIRYVIQRTIHLKHASRASSRMIHYRRFEQIDAYTVVHVYSFEDRRSVAQ